MNQALQQLMDKYYDTLTSNKANLDYVFNKLVELWSTSKRPKKIIFVEEKDYLNSRPIIFNREKVYVVGLQVKNDQVDIHIVNQSVDTYITDEILWYNNIELKMLIIEKVAEHLGYSFELGEPSPKKKRKKQK